MAVDARRPAAPAPAPTTAPVYRGAHRRTRIALVALEAFQAATAIPSAIFVVPHMPREVLEHGPFTLFSDYTIPALALGVLCGGGAVAALGAVLVRPRLGALASVVAGLSMVGFELVQIVAIGATAVDAPTDPRAWLQELYLATGGAVALLGAHLWKAETGSYRPMWPPF